MSEEGGRDKEGSGEREGDGEGRRMEGEGEGTVPGERKGRVLFLPELLIKCFVDNFDTLHEIPSHVHHGDNTPHLCTQIC